MDNQAHVPTDSNVGVSRTERKETALRSISKVIEQYLLTLANYRNGLKVFTDIDIDMTTFVFRVVRRFHQRGHMYSHISNASRTLDACISRITALNANVINFLDMLEYSWRIVYMKFRPLFEVYDSLLEANSNYIGVGILALMTNDLYLNLLIVNRLIQILVCLSKKYFEIKCFLSSYDILN